MRVSGPGYSKGNYEDNQNIRSDYFYFIMQPGPEQEAAAFLLLHCRSIFIPPFFQNIQNKNMLF